MKKIILILIFSQLSANQGGYIFSQMTPPITITTISGNDITILQSVNTERLTITNNMQLNQNEWTNSNNKIIQINSPSIQVNNLPKTQPGRFFLGLDENNQVVFYATSNIELKKSEPSYDSVQSVYFQSIENTPLFIGNKSTQNIIFGFSSDNDQTNNLFFYFNNLILTKDITIYSPNNINLNSSLEDSTFLYPFTIRGILSYHGNNFLTANTLTINSSPTSSISGNFSDAVSINLQGLRLTQTSPSLSTTLIQNNQILDLQNSSVAFNGLQKPPLLAKYNYLVVDEEGNILLKNTWESLSELRTHEWPLEINSEKIITLGKNNETILLHAPTNITTRTLNSTTTRLLIPVNSLFQKKQENTPPLQITINEDCTCTTEKIGILKTPTISIQAKKPIKIDRIHINNPETIKEKDASWILVTDQHGIVGKSKIDPAQNRQKEKLNKKIEEIKKKIQLIKKWHNFYSQKQANS
jgi:hypothetical protein